MRAKLQLLIIDDEHINRELLSAYLKDTYTLFFASKLSEAEALINTKTFSAIITDIRLGNQFDGMHLLSFIKSSAHNSKTPVIAYTASDNSINDKSYVEEGFDGYISKPSHRAQVQQVLSKLVHSN
ncbi:MAG: response regulator [Bacteroidia bacterium]|jgi:CheY-like chemotaxis protein|nr:response regulator [Bacteroidia bacterium]